MRTVRNLIAVNITFFYLVVTPVKLQSFTTASSSKCKKRLGIKIDNNLNFKEHTESLCKRSSQKLDVLSRLASSFKFYNEFFRNLSLFILSSCVDISQPNTKCQH